MLLSGPWTKSTYGWEASARLDGVRIEVELEALASISPALLPVLPASVATGSVAVSLKMLQQWTDRLVKDSLVDGPRQPSAAAQIVDAVAIVEGAALPILFGAVEVEAH